MTTPHLKLFSDTNSSITVENKPLAELDASDVQWLLESSAPVVSIAGLESQVKQQINQILATASTALVADWAAVYLLDDDTQNLILIDSCTNSKSLQQADEIRTLQFSTADLEALTGHVVTLESEQRMAYWNAPIHAKSGICVPLVSNEMPIGTVWFGFDNGLEPAQSQSALCEVIADRIVDYLTSRLMPHRVAQQNELSNLAKQWQHSRLAYKQVEIEGWDIHGWINPESPIHHTFYDWQAQENGLQISVAHAQGLSIEAALTTAVIQTGVRATSVELMSPADKLERVNEYLWQGCTGDQFADLCQLSVKQDSRQVTYSSAGSVVLLHITADGIQELSRDQAGPELGVMDYGEYENQCCIAQKGEFLIVLTENSFDSIEGKSNQDKIRKIQRTVGKGSRLSAADMIKRLRKLTLNLVEADASIVVIKRTS
ncbi:MAG: SpoIIE family protein phosphatase [Planctomycetaceae bacterium]